MIMPYDSNPETTATRNQSPVTRSDDVLVRVEGVSKKFCRSLKKSLWYGVQDIAAELNPFRGKAEKLKHGKAEKGSLSASQDVSVSDFSDGLRPGEFWAVNDVSFELRRGECLGLIGHNGAGKTTLLKMLNGLIKPDSGRIEMRGRVGALIALGAGFNPILTGRENIYVNASVLGLTKEEIDSQMEAIIDFAEIREFIDSPVQNYSSGMTVRLGFAIASSLQPDILILDEVLAVGDAGFQTKCYNRLGALKKTGACFILVSHNLQQIRRFSSRVLHLSHGETKLLAKPDEAIVSYSKDKINQDPSQEVGMRIEGTHRVEIVKTDFRNKGDPCSHPITNEGPVELMIGYRSLLDREADALIEVVMSMPSGEPFLHFTQTLSNATIGRVQRNGTLLMHLPILPINSSYFLLSIAIWDEQCEELFCWLRHSKIAINNQNNASQATATINASWTHKTI